MKTDSCSCCGVVDGEVVGDIVSKLGQYPLVKRRVISKNGWWDAAGPGHITVCQVCANSMPVDLQGLYNVQSESQRSGESDDDLLYEFLRQFIVHVWPLDSLPTFQDLADVLNYTKILTPMRQLWSYHNLQQKLNRLQFDRATVMEQRGIVVGRMPDVTQQIDAAKEMVATKTPAAVESRQARSAPALVWADAGMPLPEDMPKG